MYEGLQQGIYHLPGNEPGSSFAIVFLRAAYDHDSARIRNTLSALWRKYLNLQEGVVDGLNVNARHLYSGNLTVLMGYGPKIFEFDGVRKTKPNCLADQWLFREPTIGGGSVLGEAGLKYAEDVTQNEIANDHVIVQFIGDSQLATHRAVVETWKALRKLEMDSSNAPLVMRSFYMGFNRPDKRSWLGFHDGVSNIESSERSSAIMIDRDRVNPGDNWTQNGTYMAFLRISIDLDAWEQIPVKQQERLVGRIKSTGCPIVRIDENDNNVPAEGCPVEGTYEILDDGNKSFRAYPVDRLQNNFTSKSDTIIGNSHIARMLKNYDNTSGRMVSNPIFRQSYEFIEQIVNYPYFRVGLNFVSFQSDTERLYNILEYGLGRSNFGGDPENPVPGSSRMLFVRGCGLFFVPPFYEGQDFPGEEIFASEDSDPDYAERPIRYM